jgi:glycosyltransferase involved in cell wall biosynthesis
MRVLTFTSLYPSEARPRHGIFVEARLAAIQRVAGVEAHVVAPVPSFFFARAGSDRALAASTAHEEKRLGNRVLYPRYWSPPGLAMYVQPLTMALAAMRAVRSLARQDVEFDVIDAHYFYPDGVAAALLARWLRKPLVITARGSDVNLLSQLAWPRRLIRWAAREARGIVTVSCALSTRLRELGVPADKISVVRNGVDLARFEPVDRAEARRRLGLTDGPIVMSIGNLVQEKGHDLVIDALARLPQVQGLVVGAGPERERLAKRIEAHGLAARVRLVPEQPQSELKWLYGACDAVVLASTREGTPNVLLEAMACGTPVVAMAVGGVPEIVTEPAAGRVVATRTPEALATAIANLLGAPRAAAQTRAFAERFDWNACARAHLAVLAGASAREKAEVRCAA